MTLENEKLENVMLDSKDGFARLYFVDFEHCAIYPEHTKNPRCLGSVGKRCYVSPEQWSGREYDPFVADIWALGVMLFSIVFGFTPFRIATSSCASFRHLKDGGIARVLAEQGVTGASPEVVTLLLRLNEGAAKCFNKSKYLPVHYAAGNGAPPECVSRD